MNRRARGPKALLTAASALGAMLALAGPASAATTHTVCAPSGCDFTTIQAAVNDAGTLDGDAILVKDGTYAEDVDVTKALRLVSENGPATTTIAGPVGGVGATVSVHASGVDLDSFTVTRD